MSEPSFEKKLEIAGKAFFRDRDGTEGWKTWQDARDELRDNTSKDFIETVYKYNKEDPNLNTELTHQ